MQLNNIFLKFTPWLLSLSYLLIFHSALKAQQNNPTVQKNYVQDSMLIALQEKISQGEIQRLRDSIKNELLAAEISQIKGSSNAQKLLEKLKKLREEDSIQQSIQKEEINELRQKTVGIPATLYQDTFFTFYASLGSFNPRERALDAEANIYKLYESPLFFPDSIKIVERQGLLNIVYLQQPLMSVSDFDALWAEKNIHELANEGIRKIQFAVQKNKQLYTWQNISIRWLKALSIIAGIYLGFLLLNKLLKKFIKYLISKSDFFLKDIKIKKYELFSKRHLFRIFLKTIHTLRIIILCVIIYIGISILLSIFPSTRHFTNSLIHWVIDPVKEFGISFYQYLPKLIKIIAYFLIFRYLIKIIRYFSLEIEKGDLRIKHFHPEWANITYTLIKITLYAFCLILIFPNLPGSDTTAFRGISVFLGVLLSLGSSSAISNTIAGFVITYMRPYKVGDWIKVDNIIGKVKEKTILVTRITTINNEDVTIPNSTILSKNSVNYSTTRHELGLAISASVTMPYNIDWRVIHDLLLKAAKQTPCINPDAAPFILQKSLDTYYVTYTVNMYTNEPDKMFFIHTDLLKNIQDVFKEAHVDLNLPHPISIHNT